MSSVREEGVQTAEEWLAREGFDLTALAALPTEAPDGAGFVPDFDSYGLVCVCMSGGKDSVCLLLHLLDLGVPPEKIECVHHLVDGREGFALMDWPVSAGYCEALCRALGCDSPSAGANTASKER